MADDAWRRLLERAVPAATAPLARIGELSGRRWPRAIAAQPMRRPVLPAPSDSEPNHRRQRLPYRAAGLAPPVAGRHRAEAGLPILRVYRGCTPRSRDPVRLLPAASNETGVAAPPEGEPDERPATACSTC